MEHTVPPGDRAGREGQPSGRTGVLNSLVLVIFCVCMNVLHGYMLGIPFIQSQRDKRGISSDLCVEVIQQVAAQKLLLSVNQQLPDQHVLYDR